MITISTIVKRTAKSGEGSLAYMELRGLSTDNKPTIYPTVGGYNIDNGSVFIEIDTGKVYLYDLESTTWCEVS